MYMKTNEEVKQSRNPSPGRYSRHPLPHRRGPLLTFVFSVQKIGEQSENVYENKGQVQNVAESERQGTFSGPMSMFHTLP